MEQNFTQNQLIRFIYKESDAAEMMQIAEALSSDPVLAQEYEELLEAMEQLPQVQFQPSGDSIRTILQYSEMTALETSH
ncbi:MAG: hypothetical protein KDC44_22920 [Phaeodactylibacter sp.]|nr:hypothetical protein [Phaeodactylibacter sp.]